MTEALVLARFVHYAALVQLAGALFFGKFIAFPLDRRLRAIAWVSSALALASGLCWFLLDAVRMSGEPLSLDLVGTVARETNFGANFTLRFGLAVALAACLAGPRLLEWPATLLAAALLGGLAWAGHAGATPGFDGVIHLASDTVHLLAAGAWLGGLLPLGLLLVAAGRPGEPTERARSAAKNFSTMGVAVVVCLLASGIGNFWFLVGGVPALLGTPYGRVLIGKIILFVALLTIAAINRYRLLPALSETRMMRRLARNSFIEVALGLAILYLVGVLGTLVPGVHDQPVWPLSFRLSGEVLQQPELRGEAIETIGALIVGIAFVAGAAFWLGKLWWAVVPLALVVFVFFAPGLRLFTVEAFPTSFAQSPTGYSADAIAQGARLFAANCALCHGAAGKGDGPAVKSLGIAPAETDLTAAHVYDHSDGDLFWWISAGTKGTPMPGFADRLQPEERWALIDFVHANADGARLAAAGEGMVAVPVRAPVFGITCADGTVIDLAEPSERIIRLIFPGAEQPEISVEGVTNIVATSAPIKGVCTAPEILATAYGVLVGKNDGAITGDQFLIDGAGWVRAYWRAEATRGLTVDALTEAMHAILHNPVAAAQSSGHHHPG